MCTIPPIRLVRGHLELEDLERQRVETVVNGLLDEPERRENGRRCFLEHWSKNEHVEDGCMPATQGSYPGPGDAIPSP